MSLLPAFIKARKRNANSAPPTDAAPRSRDDDPDDNIFSLLPPRESSEAAEPEPSPNRNRSHRGETGTRST